MALCVLARPSPTRAMLIARLHHTPPAAMQATRLSPRPVEICTSSMPPQALAFSGRQSISLCKHSWIVLFGGGLEHRCFCSSSGSQQQADNNTSNAAHPYQGQQVAGSYMGQQHQSSGNMSQQNTAFTHRQQRPAYPSANNSPNPTYQPQQPQQASGSQSSQHPNASSASSTPSTSNVAGASSPPRTSAAAEVIDKYLGPSTLKLEKRDDRSPPPPPPPPRRNYGPQGTQEKKSGKDLVAESAACAVIEKYLGPWPGFPPRDPKIDEYLDSLPENAACAAIDKYFGPYKPLFVFKKNEENANNPPPPSRPPRSRMMSRARNRAWNASQQGASVDRPWTAPSQQQGPTADMAQTGQYSANAGGGSHSQGAATSSLSASSQHVAGNMPPQPSAPASQPSGVPPHPSSTSTQTDLPQGAGNTSPPQGTHMQPPYSGASSQ